MTETITAEPEPGCALCPRLVTYRKENAGLEPNWFNGAVPSFGPDRAQLLVVGLAPGRTGANKTGRPFTGDYAGDLLYSTLETFGFTTGKYDARPDDGLALNNVMITNAVRCAPPENKPTSSEINTCRSFLIERIKSLPHLRAIITLGKIAHDSTIRSFGLKLSAHAFGHEATYNLKHPTADSSIKLIGSYHCSRYNTNTGRLTEEMFHDVFRSARAHLDSLNA